MKDMHIAQHNYRLIPAFAYTVIAFRTYSLFIPERYAHPQATGGKERLLFNLIPTN